MSECHVICVGPTSSQIFIMVGPTCADMDQ
jgi:hypothetical protein